MDSEFIPQTYGLKKDHLYEILATTFSKSSISGELKPNTSCMGIKLIENNLIKMSPFPNTTTLKNLKESGIITINLVGDVYLYALAALKGSSPSISFPSNHYNYKEIVDPFDDNPDTNKILIPHINAAWALLTCIIAEENQVIKKDTLGESTISEFKLHVISWDKLKDSFNLFNRAENLALESIILATRLKVALDKNNKSLIDTIQGKIKDIIANIERFGKNENALRAIDLVSKYINSI